MSTEIFVHQAGQDIQLVTIDPKVTVQSFVEERIGRDGRAWLENADDPLRAEATLADVGVAERSHVHVSTCLAVAVEIRYGGDTITKEFPPAVTMGAVFAWAAGGAGFKLTGTERAKHSLAVCGEIVKADPAEHLGFFADADCSVCFDLAPKERFEG